MRSLHTPPQYWSGEQIENEMGGACSIYGEVERCIQGLVLVAQGKIPLGRSRHR